MLYFLCNSVFQKRNGVSSYKEIKIEMSKPTLVYIKKKKSIHLKISKIIF